MSRFKVGEWVVLNNDSLDSRICKVKNILNGVVSASPIHPYKYFNRIKNFLVHGVFIAPAHGFRLATSEEIAAGRRLCQK